MILKVLHACFSFICRFYFSSVEGASTRWVENERGEVAVINEYVGEGEVRVTEREENNHHTIVKACLSFCL
jgi:hypothetical protein